MNEGLLKGNTNGFSYGFANLLFASLGTQLFSTRTVKELIYGKLI